MRLASWVILVWLGQVSLAAAVTVQNVRIWATPDTTRVVLDLSAPVKDDVQMLSDPFRVVLDLHDAKMSAHLTQPSAEDKFLEGLHQDRHGKDLRIVLDLKKFSRSKTFQLPPNSKYGHRLVLDLFDGKSDSRIPAPTAADNDKSGVAMRDVVVVIDPGHGGIDPGARGPDGTCEKNVVLKMAKDLAVIVNHHRGMRAVLTRTGDYYLTLRKRVEIARKARADLFVSIHADSYRDPHVSGSSVYVLSEHGASSVHARWLAQNENAADLIGGVSLDDKSNVLASVLLDLSQTGAIEASINLAKRVLHSLQDIGRIHRDRVESAAFAVLKAPDIPSILVETAYISNPKEERLLRSHSHQEQIARAIFDGVRSYLSVKAPAGTLLAARKHVIARGDTLSGIAQEYQVSVKSIRDVNDLDGNLIHTGQVLTIPNASGS